MVNFKYFDTDALAEAWLDTQTAASVAGSTTTGKKFSRKAANVTGTTNTILPFNAANTDIGDFIVYDTTDKEYKILKYYGANPATIGSRYVFGNAVCYKKTPTGAKFLNSRDLGAIEWAHNFSGGTNYQTIYASTVVTGYPAATSTMYANNDKSTMWHTFANRTKMQAYLSASGSDSYVAEGTWLPMKQSTFEGLSSATDATQLALYNKYHGSYDEYCIGEMYQYWNDYNKAHHDVDELDLTSKLAGLGQPVSGDTNYAYPAAATAYNFAETVGTANAAFGAGKWALPSPDSLAAFMYDIPEAYGDTFSKINSAFDKIVAASLSGLTVTKLNITYCYWSCYDYNSTSTGVWFYNGNNGMLNDVNKRNDYRVRPILVLEY